MIICVIGGHRAYLGVIHHEHIRILKRFSLVGRAGETREQMAKAPSRCQPLDRPEHFHYYLRSPQYTVHVHVSWHSCVYAGMACTDTHEQSGDQQSTHSRQRRPASAEFYDTTERTVARNASQAKKNADHGTRMSDDFREAVP